MLLTARSSRFWVLLPERSPTLIIEDRSRVRTVQSRMESDPFRLCSRRLWRFGSPTVAATASQTASESIERKRTGGTRRFQHRHCAGRSASSPRLLPQAADSCISPKTSRLTCTFPTISPASPKKRLGSSQSNQAFPHSPWRWTLWWLLCSLIQVDYCSNSGDC